MFIERSGAWANLKLIKAQARIPENKENKIENEPELSKLSAVIKAIGHTNHFGERREEKDNIFYLLYVRNL
jgi:hypothetical protein